MLRRCGSPLYWWMTPKQSFILTYLLRNLLQGLFVSSRSSCIFSCPLGYHWVLPFPPWLHRTMSTHRPLWRAYTQASYSSHDSHFPLHLLFIKPLLQDFKEVGEYDKWPLPSLMWEESMTTHSVCLANTSIVSNVLSQCINSIELFKERVSVRVFRDSTDISLGIACLKFLWRMLMTYMLSTC